MEKINIEFDNSKKIAQFLRTKKNLKRENHPLVSIQATFT